MGKRFFKTFKVYQTTKLMIYSNLKYNWMMKKYKKLFNTFSNINICFAHGINNKFQCDLTIFID